VLVAALPIDSRATGAPPHQSPRPFVMNHMLSGFVASLAFTATLAVSPASAQGGPDTLAKIKAAKAINVAFSGDSPPYSFVDKANAPGGYSIDLCKKVIAQIGRTAGVPDLKVNWLVGTVADRLSMVASGKADLECANTTATQSRMQTVDFSSLIFVESGGFLVTAGGPTQKLSDLAGKRIGVLAGTTTETRLFQILRDRQIDAKITKLKDGNEGVAMLESGSLDAFASDKIKLIGLATQAKDPGKLALLTEDLSYEPLAFALPRGDSTLRLEVNKALTRVYAGGEIDAIFGQWFGALGRPTTLLAAMFVVNTIPE
jgi:glutamate/aspartate transport system substrate-binding protein